MAEKWLWHSDRLQSAATWNFNGQIVSSSFLISLSLVTNPDGGKWKQNKYKIEKGEQVILSFFAQNWTLDQRIQSFWSVLRRRKANEKENSHFKLELHCSGQNKTNRIRDNLGKDWSRQVPKFFFLLATHYQAAATARGRFYENISHSSQLSTKD